MAIISAATWALCKAGLQMDEQTLMGIVSPLWLYIGGTSLSDAFGKGKIEAEANAKANAALPASSDGE